MKYIIKNIKTFMLNDTFVFVLIVCNICLSCSMIFFAYAIFQNYEIKKKAISEQQDYIVIKADYEYDRIYDDAKNYGSYKYADYEGQSITLGQIRELGYVLDERLYDKIINISLDLNCDNYCIPCQFCYYNYGIGPSKSLFDNYSKGLLDIDGRLYTEDEFNSGSDVAVIYDCRTYENSGITKEMLYDNEHIKIGGNLYKIIGYQGMMIDAPYIPINAFYDDTRVSNIVIFQFDDYVTMFEYNKVCDAVEKVFGEFVHVEPMKLPDVDTLRLYNTIIIVAVIISIIAATNYAILYKYILKKRARQIINMRICGMNYYSGIAMYLGECFLLNSVIYVFAAIIFSKLLMPIIANRYEYGFDYLNYKVYIAIFLIYMCISAVMLVAMLYKNINKKKILCEV